MQIETFFEILLSLALGALIGIERERRAKTEIFAGIRTFMLVSLFGYLTAFLAQNFGKIVMHIGLAGILSISILNHLLTYKKVKRVGVTTEIAFIITYLIGILIFFDSFPYLLPVSLSILITLILFSREAAHRFAKHLKREELRDGLTFAILAFVILPILPNKTIDPFQILNPFLIWLAIVLVLGTSFLAYIAMKILGAEKGLLLSGFFGGLISSTSLTISMAEKIKQKKTLVYPAISAILISYSTMYLRMLLIGTIFNFQIFYYLLLPLFSLSVLSLFFAYFFSRKNKFLKKEKVEIRSPLSLNIAFRFGIIFLIVLTLIRIIERFPFFGGIYIASFFSGIADVDAITISLSTSPISLLTIKNGIILASASNTIFKFLFFHSIVSKKISKKFLFPIFSILLFSILFILI